MAFGTETLGWILAAGFAAAALRATLISKRTQQAFEDRWMQRQQTLHSELGKLRSNLGDLQARVAEAERHAETLVGPSRLPNGINFSKRAMATRLLRRGDSISQVAAAAGLPTPEVDLLAKVCRMVAASIRNPPPTAANPAPEEKPSPSRSFQ